MARSFYIRLRRGDHLLDHEVEFPDLESARRGAAKGAKALLSECIKRGRNLVCKLADVFGRECHRRKIIAGLKL
jgi:hypothetical protein